VQNVCAQKMVKTQDWYISLDVEHVCHLRAPKILSNPGDNRSALDGSCQGMNLKIVDNISYRGVQILRTMTYKHLNSATVIEWSSLIGNNVKDSHLCKNLSVGLWMSLNLCKNLILSGLPKISSQNSTLWKFFMALDSSRQLVEKSKSSLKWE
jgi:hypothetical protein